MPKKIEISHKTILFTFFTLIILWFLYQIREIIFLLFLSLILAATLHSPVEFLTQKKIPRPLGILVLYLLILFGFGGTIALLVPPLVEETTKLVNNLPAFFGSLNRLFLNQLPAQELLKSLTAETKFLGSNVFRFTLGFFGNIITLFTIFVFTFYLLLRWKNLPHFLATNFSDTYKERISRILDRIESGLGSWLRGEVILCLTIGLLSFLGLTLLKIPYALPLALFAGIMEIIPLIGPLVSAVPAILVALTISPLLALACGALYLVIQQLENNLIVPKVMQKATGVDPLVTIIVLMIGVKLMGVLGAFLSVPLVVLLKILLRELLQPT